MKILTYFVCILVVIIACNSGKELTSEHDKYFEGVVTYSIEYTNSFGNIPPDKLEQLKELIGSKMVLTFKNGNYRKDFLSPSGKILGERFLNLQQEKNYHIPHDLDTIYWFDITRYDMKTDFKQIKDSVILNQPVTGVATETIISNYGERIRTIKGIYYYAKELNVNPSWYKNYKESNFREIIKIGKGIQLYYLNEGVYWTQIIQAVDISHRKVKDSEITIRMDKNKALIEL